MGTVFFMALQAFYPSRSIALKDAPPVVTRDSWETVARFQFGKDYVLSMTLHERYSAKQFLSEEERESLDLDEYEDCCNPIIIDNLEELPTLTQVYEQRSSASPRYACFLFAAEGLKHLDASIKRRAIFWSDQ